MELAVVPARSDRGARGAHDDLHAVRAEPGALTNLREETRPLAPRLAGALAWMYVLAIPFVTVWLTVFTGRDGVGSVLFIYQSGVYQ